MAARVNKKSRKREKQMERVKKTLKVGRRRLHLRQLIFFYWISQIAFCDEALLINFCFVLQKRKNSKKAPVFNFSAIHLVRDPQSN